ncbi:arrestin domain-containing protein 5 [Ditylenchus destructor]|uniref:Arrestin domain-containing protein 5 n=1 Tax=Ditylenchus destructor TaxID=166010 RepID=A0AAD4MLR6_9BILA|nr:arrestin domain-containing protein 5 [Ditylenchus destructor]
MVDTFRIELFSTQNVFFPGQIVKGQCILSLRQQIKARSVKVELVGKAYTNWLSTDGVNSENKKQNDDHSAEVLYMNNMIALWLATQPDHQLIEAGSYEWPFTFTLPTKCPPSFES